MAALSSINPRLNLKAQGKHNSSVIAEEIQGLIKVYGSGHVERPTIIPCVPPTTTPPSSSNHGATSTDAVIDGSKNLWARIYVPTAADHGSSKQLSSVLVYFHGGGFCVGSASWSCYHDFLTNLASKTGCVVFSVNYRLAPENKLPAAYDDGCNSVLWLKQLAASACKKNSSTEHHKPRHSWWVNRCDFSNLFLAGDSSGANIAYNVALRLGPNISKQQQQPSSFICSLKGMILIQPFFGGETRTASENKNQPPGSVLSLSASDTYWRLSLPAGAGREHPWCNPLASHGNYGSPTKLRGLSVPPMLVCVSEMDILKDRNLEFCAAMAGAGKMVQAVMCRGVGHGFQILNGSALARDRTGEMVAHVKGFIKKQLAS